MKQTYLRSLRKRLINDLMPNFHMNFFYYVRTNSPEHELVKFQIYAKLRQLGRDVLVEAIFSKGIRADVIDVNNLIAYEVMKSETIKKLQKKIKRYPSYLNINPIEIKKFDLRDIT